MLLQLARKKITQRISARFTSSVERNPNLHRDKDQRDITNMDLIEERIRLNSSKKVREIVIDGQRQQWAYRSELVSKHNLDKDHRYTWLAYMVIICVGFGAFVAVKSQVVMGRREEMEAREAIRRELQLSGDDRKKIGVV
ncbi:unnamed protein product [Caenorhabditis bovis]|uniref:Uncharacterized protein n=1 Tax=Caenorhabditis bovis TaxID=2654633 RepID=A0A8S1FAB3_9PELO|nr:unnamed protein product [Caenorhabditis bovis]